MKDANKDTAVLLLHCPDKQGILAAVTEWINSNKGNIIYLDQHVDPAQHTFFMRVEWELEQFLIPADKVSEYFQTLLAQKYEMEFKIYFHKQKPKMAIFVSRQAHCLYDLLAHYEAGDWNVEIPCIISNHPDLKFVADKFNIPYFVFPLNKDNKAEIEPQERELLREMGIDFIVLAKYMQVISPDMIQEYPNRIINIHHSFLPAFIGAKPYHAAYERGVKIIGATSHYVTEELDAGPIIEQDIARISHKHNIDDIIRKGQDLEKIVLTRAVEKHIERKILVYKNKTIVF